MALRLPVNFFSRWTRTELQLTQMFMFHAENAARRFVIGLNGATVNVNILVCIRLFKVK